MATIEFRRPADVGDFVTSAEFVASATYRAATADLPAGETDLDDVDLEGTGVRVFFPGGPDDLQLFEIEVEPGHRVEPHAHLEDEIVYVTQGTLHFGARACGAGSAVLVRGRTLYGFTAGDEGARFLNFRARQDFTTVSRADFLRERAAARGDEPDEA